MKKYALTIVAMGCLATLGYQELIVSSARAQSGSSIRGGAGSFESRFWTWLQNANYKNWTTFPGKDFGAFEGQSPHGAFLRMYIDRTAASNPKNPPQGSVIIKENYGPDKKTLMAVTVMYRSQGYNPTAGDWYWVKYMPDGTVAMKGDMRLAGRLKGCVDCHSGAEGDDFLFAND